MTSLIFEKKNSEGASILEILIPPVACIALAILSRKIILSLFVGLFMASFIAKDYQAIDSIVYVFKKIFESSEIVNLASYEKFSDSWNLHILLFCLSLSLIIGLITSSGAIFTYAERLTKKLKTRKQAKFFTFFAGLIIFFDDYFNTLTIGSLMKPVYDKLKIAREKLAYIVDSTAAPVCILAPVSTWALEIKNQLKKAGAENYEAPYDVFLKSILYNFYPFITIFLMLWFIKNNRSFKLMRYFETKADTEDQPGPHEEKSSRYADYGISDFPKNTPLKWAFLPAAVFLLTTTLLFGVFDHDLTRALAETGIVTTLFTVVTYAGFKVVSLKMQLHSLRKSFTGVAPALGTLILAWGFGSLLRDDLKVGEYLISAIGNKEYLYYLPLFIFPVACLTSYATGSSWGTFGILIPIFIPLALEQFHASPELTYMFLGAILSGSIFGDHSSPISDTTLLSSIGAGCPHIDHVKSQQPYAFLAGFVTLLCLAVMAIIGNASIGIAIGCLTISAIILNITLKQLFKTAEYNLEK